MLKGLGVVITGAPNLSNEAGLRAGARCVERRMEKQRASNEDRAMRARCVRTKCWSSLGEGDGQGEETRCMFTPACGH